MPISTYLSLLLPFHQVSVLGDLTELVHLDISDDKDDHPPFDILAPGAKFKISTLLQKINTLPNLHSFDISGKCEKK